jgi:hypothetical protein
VVVGQGGTRVGFGGAVTLLSVHSILRNTHVTVGQSMQSGSSPVMSSGMPVANQSLHLQQLRALLRHKGILDAPSTGTEWPPLAEPTQYELSHPYHSKSGRQSLRECLQCGGEH